MLVKNMQSYRTKAGTQAGKDAPKAIKIGGPVCKILDYCEVKFKKAKRKEPDFMDVQYLSDISILKKKLFCEKFVYRLSHPKRPKALVALPLAPDFSILQDSRNAKFILPLGELLDSEQVKFFRKGKSSVNRSLAAGSSGSRPPKSRRPKNHQEREPLALTQTREPSPENLDDFDPEEHYFEEYWAPKLTKNVSEAHKRIGTLQKLTKWLVKTVKGLSKEVSMLSRKLGGEPSRDAPVIERRRSISATPYEVEPSEEPITEARHSAVEPGALKRRRKRLRRIPEPSTEASNQGPNQGIKHNPYALRVEEDEPALDDEPAPEEDPAPEEEPALEEEPAPEEIPNTTEIPEPIPTYVMENVYAPNESTQTFNMQGTYAPSNFFYF